MAFQHNSPLTFQVTGNFYGNHSFNARTVRGLRDCSTTRNVRLKTLIYRYLIVDRLLVVGGCSFHRCTMGVSIFLARFRRRVGVSIRRVRRGFQQGTGTGVVVDGGLRIAGNSVAPWQRRSGLSRGRCDGFSTFYQFNYLVCFPRKIAVWSERIIPTTVRTENSFFPIKVLPLFVDERTRYL